MRFQTAGIPSTGTMEISKNDTWEKLCTGSWDDIEENLTCMAMGYYANYDYGPINNGTWYKGANTSNTTTHHDCSSLTQNCMNNSNDKLQFCKGTFIY